MLKIKSESAGPIKEDLGDYYTVDIDKTQVDLMTVQD
jgi:hypothetical protein